MTRRKKKDLPYIFTPPSEPITRLTLADYEAQYGKLPDAMRDGAEFVNVRAGRVLTVELGKINVGSMQSPKSNSEAR